MEYVISTLVVLGILYAIYKRVETVKANRKTRPPYNYPDLPQDPKKDKR